MSPKPQDIITFWRDAGPKKWFAHDPQFDRVIADRFGPAHRLASEGKLSAWEDGAPGAIALLILTDQFPRNIYRGSAHAFATDSLARAVADRAIARGFDQAFDLLMRQFFYLPYQHHEDMTSQNRAVAIYENYVAAGGDPETLRFARLHADLIARFGRFPHRNAVMGRISTADEIGYLASGGFAG